MKWVWPLALLGGCLAVHDPATGRTVWYTPGRVTVVESRHICTAACHHYYHDGRWYDEERHVHTAGCGHHFWGGRWHGVREVTVQHVHAEGCGHYWHHGKWYEAHGHVHGPGCGHAVIEGRWSHRD